MKQIYLLEEEILAGYDAVSQLYPYIPPLMVWRAWEYAAYQRYTLVEPVLDVGCGDGRYFQLAFPRIKQVVGVDMDADTVEAARRSGVYHDVHQAMAHQIPVPPASFESAFANCSLEHMDQLGDVLSSIARSLRPGGKFLLSVVTDKFVEWATLPLLIARTGDPVHARVMAREHISYHHLVNALSSEAWVACLEQAGFEVLEHIPVLPEMTSRLFLLLDHLWHAQQPEGELGELLHSYLQGVPNFTQGFREILSGVLKMEARSSACSGAIFWAKKAL